MSLIKKPTLIFVNIPNHRTTFCNLQIHFTVHNDKSIYNCHSRITGCLRNYNPIKQYFCLLPHNDTSRPLIVPQEYLIHFDYFLLPCYIPTSIVKPLTGNKHLVSSPLYDKDKSYYTALSKQSHFYNELLCISA